MARPIKIKEARKAQELRAKGLTYRQIMKILDVTNTKTVYRWLRYQVGVTVDKYERPSKIGVI